MVFGNYFRPRTAKQRKYFVLYGFGAVLFDENEGIIKKIDAILTIYTKYVEIFSEECYNCGDKIQAALFRQGRLVSRVGAKIFGFYAVNTKGAMDT